MNRPQMKILVTAFGPFGGRTENASSLALRALKSSYPEISTRILPVDAVIAPSRLKQAIRKVRPEALIMLGEAAGSQKIRLETIAWNELDFRIPDIAGRQFDSRPILTNSPTKRRSTLPIRKLLKDLEAAGHQVTLSDDPGRYLCNQVFYVALDHLAPNTTTIPAGFIHLPLENDYPTARVADALAHLIRLLGHPLGGLRA